MKEVSLHVEVIFDKQGQLIDIRNTKDPDGLVSFVSDLSLSCPSCQCHCRLNLLVHDRLTVESTATNQVTNYSISYLDTYEGGTEEKVTHDHLVVNEWDTQENSAAPYNSSFEQDHAYTSYVKVEVVEPKEEDGDSDATTLTANSGGGEETDEDSDTMSVVTEANNQTVNVIVPTKLIPKPMPTPPPPKLITRSRQKTSTKEKHGCAYCLEIFPNPKLLMEHKSNHTLTCYICDPLRTFSNLYALGYHVLQKHRNLRDQMNVVNAKECLKCHNKYFDQSYVRHIKICVGKSAVYVEDTQPPKKKPNKRRKKRVTRKKKV